MIGTVSLLALIAIVALIAWTVGSFLARLVGALLVLDALLKLTTIGVNPAAFVTVAEYLAIGIAVWLLGHWIWAFKHRTWRTQLAYRSFGLPLLRALAPIPPAARRRGIRRAAMSYQAGPVYPHAF